MWKEMADINVLCTCLQFNLRKHVEHKKQVATELQFFTNIYFFKKNNEPLHVHLIPKEVTRFNSEIYLQSPGLK